MINITIDGHSGCGKSTTAREVAKQLGFIYLDTGAMYRAVTLAVIRAGIDENDSIALGRLLSSLDIQFLRDGVHGEHLTTLMNDEDVEYQIRSMEVSNRVSDISKIGAVRTRLVEWQRNMARKKGVVMEGRDVGTVVLPHAELKIFMTADLEVRATRRLNQLKAEGIQSSYDEILNNLRERDRIDSSRGIAPLRKAKGAFEIDTSHMNMEEQIKKIVDLAKKIIHE